MQPARGSGRSVSVEIGPRLKAIRKERGLSLRALGERSDFSASFLSQVELGQASPSLASLERIAQALGVTLAELLSAPPAAQGPLLRRRAQDGLHSEWSRATVQSLLPAGADARTAVVLVSLEPSGRSGKAHRAQQGQALAFCVKGKVVFTLDEVAYELGAGDSIYYDATQANHWSNPGDRRAEILFVTLRGT